MYVKEGAKTNNVSQAGKVVHEKSKTQGIVGKRIFSQISCSIFPNLPGVFVLNFPNHQT